MYMYIYREREICRERERKRETYVLYIYIYIIIIDHAVQRSPTVAQGCPPGAGPGPQAGLAPVREPLRPLRCSIINTVVSNSI